MASTGRLVARWSVTFMTALCIASFAAFESGFAMLALLVLLPLTLVVWWPPTSRTTDDRHCSECGYPFPAGAERRCPECGSVD